MQAGNGSSRQAEHAVCLTNPGGSVPRQEASRQVRKQAGAVVVVYPTQVDVNPGRKRRGAVFQGGGIPTNGTCGGSRQVTVNGRSYVCRKRGTRGVKVQRQAGILSTQASQAAARRRTAT